MSDKAGETIDAVFDLVKLKKVNPWDVKISGALKQLSKELREKGYLQFTLSGLVLLASSIIYLRKTEVLLSIDSELRRKAQGAEEEVLDIPSSILERISPLEVPIRPSQPVIDLEHLVKALSEILEKAYLKKPLEEEPLPPIVPQQDDFIRDIEKKVEDFKATLYESIRRHGRVSIGSLLEGKQSLEAARTFILILFILSEPDFDIFFEDDEYYIVMKNGFEEHGV